ncbi:MAG: amidophosphoribosyltransferase [Neisseriaceae bacterium]|nr:amidophosphoribosyltransferase [Neisseriaceae bacterium]
MCGILGIVAATPVNQEIYDGLQVLQHRGQDAAGITTFDGTMFRSFKGIGMVRDVFHTRNMRDLTGNAGIAHVRYPTAGNRNDPEQAQPFYVNSPFGISFAHNGNLTNTEQLVSDVINKDFRHINTTSDSEILLNVLAFELEKSVLSSNHKKLTPEIIFNAVRTLHQRVSGAYAAVALIAGYGLLAFRDPFGIRPLILGKRRNALGGFDYSVSSESVSFSATGFEIVRDIAPGEAVFIDFSGSLKAQICTDASQLCPCLFEYIYFARPDSVIDGVSVYQARLEMGAILAQKVKTELPHDIDVVMPIPDTSRPSALELARHLGLPYREGLIKNRYIGRTFIMPGQAVRKKSVRQKLSPIDCEFAGKNVLLVDDSIVRGTTSREIVEMARLSGAKKVYLASAAPEVRYPNVYGIDMPTKAELIANGRTPQQIAAEIGADGVVFQDLAQLVQCVAKLNPAIQGFDTSCFNGKYLAGNIDEQYLDNLAQQKSKSG